MTARTVALVALAAAALAGCGASSLPGDDAPVGGRTPAAAVVPPVTAALEAPSPGASVPDIPRAASTLDRLETMPAPSGLVLERWGIEMPVQGVGYAEDGSMELPESATTAGWFRLGGHPAGGPRDGMNVVLAAHVDDATVGLGPFARLREAQPGDRVGVRLADGSLAWYRVDRVEQTAKRDVDLAQVFRDSTRALVLVTCGGRWDASVRHYEDNVLVWAYPEDAR